MLILPAIDLRGGQCVRLRQGDYAQETVFGDDPAAMARRWVEQGAAYLHLVDLDGASEGRPVNGASVRAIVAAAGVPCQLGGGLRTEAASAGGACAGASSASSSARAPCRIPAWLGGDCAVASPAGSCWASTPGDGKVATEGWLEVSETPALDLARAVRRLAAGRPRLHGHQPRRHAGGAELRRPWPRWPRPCRCRSSPRAASPPWTTSAGSAGLGLAGCIIGRALYEGRLDLAEVIHAAGSLDAAR